MNTPLGPDLSRILPKPWVHRLASAEPPYRAAMTTAQPAQEDFLVDVRPPPTSDAAETPGFGLAQATAVAARVQRVLRDAPARPSLHQLDGERSAGLLANVERTAASPSLLVRGPAAAAPANVAPGISTGPAPH